VLLEAMATGACCVATATPALADYLADDTVVSVPPADPDALRQAIEALLSDPRHRAALGARARARAVEEFDARLMWARIADASRLAAKSRHVDR
jgi:glycosyltransferase involved in cell wall biosynthesis